MHVPVLLERVLALLAPAIADRPAVAVDATLGLGGHAEALLAAHPQLTLVGLDRDPAALVRSRDRLARFGSRVHLVHARYDRMPDVLSELGYPGVDGVLFDLGVSSMQLDVAGARLLLRAGRAAGHADGSGFDDHRRRRREQLPDRRTRPRAARLRRGTVRAAYRPSAGPGPRGGAASLHRPARRTGAQRDPGGYPAARRPSGQAHLPGAAHRGQRGAGRVARPPCRRQSTRSSSVDVWSCCPTTRSRTGSSSARFRSEPATPPRPGCRSHCPNAARSCGCSPAAPRPPSDAEVSANPRAASVRLRAAERIRKSA